MYKTFFVPFDKEFINRKYEKQKPNMISQSDEPAPEELVVRKKLRHTASVTSSLSSSIGESGLSGVTRVNVTPEKRITKKNKYISPKLCLHFFLEIKYY